jgi:hypothetical protein
MFYQRDDARHRPRQIKFMTMKACLGQASKFKANSRPIHHKTDFSRIQNAANVIRIFDAQKNNYEFPWLRFGSSRLDASLTMREKKLMVLGRRSREDLAHFH